MRKHEKVPLTPCERLLRYCRESGDEAAADALETWRSLHDPFELKDWIEKRLKMIWKLDAALIVAENERITALARVAEPILRGHLRSAPVAPQNQKHDSAVYRKTIIKPNPNQDPTKSTKAA